MSSLAGKDTFLSKLDMIMCGRTDVTALNDVAACNPSVSVYCCLFLPWITDELSHCRKHTWDKHLDFTVK